MKTPCGALSDKERITKQKHGERGGKGWYLVDGKDGSMGGSNNTTTGEYRFVIDSDDGTYYFNNYWFALAYSLRLKAKLKAKS
jgi:hypothetical protein